MEEQESGMTFMEWINSLSIADAVNIIMMVIFTIFITILVYRTFRNKPSA